MDLFRPPIPFSLRWLCTFLWSGGNGCIGKSPVQGGLGGISNAANSTILEKLELPYLGFCYEAVANRDYNELLILNEEISAWKLTREYKRCWEFTGNSVASDDP